MIQPLEGLLVLDLSQNLAGPFCGQILGDMGAEVVKIEPPGVGDAARAWGPPFWDGESTIFMAGNRNKRGLAVNLKAEEGKALLRRLVARADVFVQSFRAGVVDVLGFGYDDVRALNPRLVYCSITAFGARGPLRELPGYDPLLQAYGGLMSVTGHSGGPPARVGTSVVDMGTAMWAALGILGALKERERTGAGTHVVASLLDTALMWSSYHLMGYLATGVAPGPQGAGIAMIAPYDAFPTSDGHLMIAAANDSLFRRACVALGVPELVDDARFADNPARVRHRDALFERLATLTRRETSGALEERFRAAGVPCAQVLSMDQVTAEPQTEATAMLRSTPHPRIPDYRELALPIEWDGRRPDTRRVPPLAGEHTAEVLRELGYADEEIERMRRDGVVA